MYILGAVMYILGANMYILGANMYILGANMNILGANVYIVGKRFWSILSDMLNLNLPFLHIPYLLYWTEIWRLCYLLKQLVWDE